MKRFKNILLVCDEETLDETQVERAIWLAKANGARVSLVQVLETAPGELARLIGAMPGGGSRDVEADLLKSYKEGLAKQAEPFRAAGIDTSETLLQGISFIEIVRQVLRADHDLVMKRAGGSREGTSVFFASTDLHLMRKCPCPVWIMNPSPRPRYNRILAAINPDPSNAQRYALNRLVLDLATSLSAADGSELQVVHAWQLEEEESLRKSAFARVPKRQIQALVDAHEAECLKQMEQVLAGYSGLEIGKQVKMLPGHARTAIPEFAEAQQVELIIMGTVGRTGVRGLIIGNTAEAILNQVHCAVMAVKPPGFQTPIEV
ncbi:MAG: universal stress protein [Pseudomonadota bacterium]